MFPNQLNPNPAQSPAVSATRKRAYNGRGRRAGAVLGEIVEVAGGHIVRSTGRKDRHSKVCTAKGPRDRRVRLSASTAIQFYDVQDRLGYDRPSKAVDWLIEKAQSAIDELDELPPWEPSAIPAGKKKTPTGDSAEEEPGILPNSIDSDSIADIKSFPVAGESAPVQFPTYQSEDLKLSLQSFENPILIQSHHNQTEEENQSSFPITGWEDNTQPEDFGRFQRLIGWNLAGGGYTGGGSGGFVYIPPSQPLPPPLLFGHGFTQRSPLQSNNTLSGIGFATTGAGFSSYHIHGEEFTKQDGNVPNNSSQSGQCG